MDTAYGDISARTEGKDLEIANGRVCVRFIYRDGGYVRELSASVGGSRYALVLSSIHKALIPSSEHRASASPMISGDRSHLFGVCRDSLRMVYSNVELMRHDSEAAVVRLTGSVLGHSLRCQITMQRDSSALDVVVEDVVAQGPFEPVLEYLMCSYAFLPDGQQLVPPDKLDYAWAPLMRPASCLVVGDRAFSSPAVIARKGKIAAAIVPDLELLSSDRPMPTALDLDVSNGLLYAPLMSYGFCDSMLSDDGRCCRHDATMTRYMREPRLRYGYTLLLQADLRRGSIVSAAARLAWERNGACCSGTGTLPESGSPLVIDDEPDAWRTFALGLRATASGHPDLRLQARREAQALLAVPQHNGLFQTGPSPVSTAVPGAAYSAVECSNRLYWMLKYCRSVEPNEEIAAYCRRYADFLIEARLRTGAIPTWYDSEGISISSMRSAANTAASARLLGELAEVTGSRAYARAFEQCARFLADRAAAGASFADVTCMDPDCGRSFELPDPHSQIRPMGSWGMIWTAETCLRMFEYTRNPRDLTRGCAVLDQLCLLQTLRPGEWCPEVPSGALSSGNLKVGPDAAITAEFARCAAMYGAATGHKEYFERGTAALRAACSMAQLPTEASNCVAACRADIESLFGSAYLHVSKKWAVGVVGDPVKSFSIERRTVFVQLRESYGDASGRIVFGGLSGSSYRVEINGHSQTYSAEELSKGIEIPRVTRAPRSQRQRRPVQGQLFDPLPSGDRV